MIEEVLHRLDRLARVGVEEPRAVRDLQNAGCHLAPKREADQHAKARQPGEDVRVLVAVQHHGEDQREPEQLVGADKFRENILERKPRIGTEVEAGLLHLRPRLGRHVVHHVVQRLLSDGDVLEVREGVQQLSLEQVGQPVEGRAPLVEIRRLPLRNPAHPFVAIFDELRNLELHSHVRDHDRLEDEIQESAALTRLVLGGANFVVLARALQLLRAKHANLRGDGAVDHCF